MNLHDTTLRSEEKATFSLRELYQAYGYTQYKMSKFEEYDLYAENKDFLISESIITFTDTNGKLMALKPDVTLSIIRNTQDVQGSVQKVFYDENVYRVSGSTRAFKEIPQVGLECIGDLDDYCVCEVLLLAAESLRRISETCVLSVSHLGLLFQVLDALQVSAAQRKELLRCVGEKNLHELAAVCQEAGIRAEERAVLEQLLVANGTPAQVMPVLRSLFPDSASLAQLQQAMDLLEQSGLGDIVRIDFSIANGSGYYNGIVFKGFVAGIPTSVISGGRYDTLLEKMGRKSGAIGFAVYLDMLELLAQSEKRYDVDAVLLYDDTISPEAVSAAVRQLTAQGTRVMAQRAVPDKVRFRELLKLTEGGVTVLESRT